MTLVKTDLGFLRIIQIFKIVGRETNNNKGKFLQGQLGLAFKISDDRLIKLLNQPRAINLIEQSPSFIPKVSVLSASGKTLLLDDLIDSPELMEILISRPTLLDIWEKMNKSQVDQAIRKNSDLIKRLEKLNCTL